MLQLLVSRNLPACLRVALQVVAVVLPHRAQVVVQVLIAAQNLKKKVRHYLN